MGIAAVAVFRGNAQRRVVVRDRAIAIALGLVGLPAIGVGGRVAGIDLDRLVEVGDGAVVVGLALPDQAAVVPPERIAGVDADGPIVVGERAVEIALGAVGVAAVVEGAGVVGGKLERLAVVFDRLFVVALVVIEDAAVVVGDREIVAGPAAGRNLPRAGRDPLIELRLAAVAELLVLLERGRGNTGCGPRRQRFSRNAERKQPLPRLLVGISAVAVFLRDRKRCQVIDLRALDIALFLIGLAAIGVGRRIAGVDPDRLIEIGDRAVVLALALPREATVVPAERVFPVDLDGSRVVVDGAVVVALGREGIAAIVEGARVVGRKSSMALSFSSLSYQKMPRL
jgi:hypothetical protein